MFSKNKDFSLLLLLLLLAVFCGRIWSVGVTSTDDALWALWAHQADQHPVRDFAVDQGRLWALGAGTWLLYALRYAGTAYGDALVVGGFLVFFFLFLAVVSVYWSRSTAFAAAAIFVAFTVLRNDRTILTTYPLFFWVPASAALGAVLSIRRYQKGMGWPYLAAGGGLFLLSLFNNEGALVMTLLALPVAIVANGPVVSLRVWQSHEDRLALSRQRTALVVVALVSLVFIVLSAGWRLSHASGYAGTRLAPFDLHRIGATLFNFTTSGTLFYDLVHPYAQVYVDAVGKTASRVTYDPWSFARGAGADVLSIVVGSMVCVLVLRQLTAPALVRMDRRRALCGIAVGAVIAVLPLAPVALTDQYQRWFYDHDLHAYSHTVFANFGLALMLAVTLQWLCVGTAFPRAARMLAIVLALGLSMLSVISHRVNDAIARDIRPEAGRWHVLRSLAELSRATATNERVIWMPRLRSGTWFAVVPSGYWTDYARTVLDWPVDIKDERLDRRDMQTGATYADFRLSRDDRSFILTNAHLTASPSGASGVVVADRIGVLIEDPSLSLSSGLVLAYRDSKQTQHFRPIRELQRVGARAWQATGVEALPESIAVLEAPHLTSLSLACGDRVSGGTTLAFAEASQSTNSCFAGDYAKEGWWPTEREGRWTIRNPAVIRIPAAGLAPGDLALTIDAVTYAAMEGLSTDQRVRILVNDKELASWSGAELSSAHPIVIPAAAWRERSHIVLQFDVNPLVRPSEAGRAAADTRTLGLHLRSLRLRAAGQP